MVKKKDDGVTRGMLDEAVDAIVEGVGRTVSEATKKIVLHMDTRFKHQKDDIDGLKAEFSDTPSRSEFNDLKSRIQKLEKAQVSN